MAPAVPLSSEQHISIRPMDGMEEFLQAEQVQREAWGYREIDIAPSSIFSVARNFGGQAIGAFDGKRMVGYALSFGSLEEGHAHFHSHMVAVIPEYQNRGLGKRIKLAQRDDALSRGVDQIVWTFDPLQIRNAHFNFSRLGGVGVRYLPNLYGKTSSPLHGGLPTDRLLVEWNLNSQHVLDVLSGVCPAFSTDSVSIQIPRASSDVPFEMRLDGQSRLRNELMRLLEDGYLVTGFEAVGDKSSYILERTKTGLTETR